MQPDKNYQPHQNEPSQSHDPSTRHAAADIIRSQLTSIYNSHQSEQTQSQPQSQPAQPQSQPEHTQPQPQPTAHQPSPSPQPTQPSPQLQPDTKMAQDNAYRRTYSEQPQQYDASKQWKNYHSAWQNYYQKYYERYYVDQVHRTKSQLEQRANEAVRKAIPAQQAHPQVAPAQPVTQTPPSQESDSISQNEAMSELKGKLLDKVSVGAKKVRKSRHFMPIVVALCVVLVFVFLQYNRVLIGSVQAYIMPGEVDPENIIIDPTDEVSVSNEPRLIIPKINVDVPAIYHVGTDHKSQMNAMQKGVAHFGIPGADSVPGQVGNTVLSGHSSNDLLDKGDYKFIFAQVPRLKKGDTIYANYKGTRYTYKITKKQTVKPTNVKALQYDGDKPILTLITCVPIGTALNRLLVTAEQVSPDPNGAKPAPADSGDNDKDVNIPGNSPTFMERIFGSN